MDWGTEGYKAALNGGTLEETQSHFGQACESEYKVAADSARLQAGFEEGQREFCQGDRALEFGMSGGVYRGTCSREPAAEDKFLTRYNTGRLEYLTQRVSELESQNSSLSDEVDSVRRELRDCKDD